MATDLPAHRREALRAEVTRRGVQLRRRRRGTLALAVAAAPLVASRVDDAARLIFGFGARFGLGLG